MKRPVWWVAMAILFAAVSAGAAPTSYLPEEHRVYDFLERMELHWFITDAHLGVRPITRARAAELLLDAKKNAHLLSRADREEMACLLDEFGPDVASRNGLVWDDRGPIERVPGFLRGYVYRNRRNLYSTAGDTYSLSIDPVVVRSGEVKSRATAAKDERVFASSNGFVMHGTAGGNVGFFVDVRDSQEWGSRYYPPATVTTMPGRGFVSFKGDHAEFDETNAALTYKSGPFAIQFGRGGTIWGRGKRGTLLLSDYSSPYDMLKVEAEFRRLRYTFIAAEIEQYPPVARFYYVSSPGIVPDSVTVAKRFSAHRLDIDLSDRLALGFSETVVYGGRWDLSYLNPVMFLRGAEHTNGDHDNAVMAADFRWLTHRSHSIYGEFLIDDLTTGKLGTGWYGNKFAWQLGTFLVEPLALRDVDARVEYTRINPWVYTHHYPINVYDHYGSALGYSTGPNSDDLSVEIRKRFSRRLKVTAVWSRTRHGANPPGLNIGGNMKSGWKKGDPTVAHFLDGIVRVRSSAGYDVSWEPLWGMFVKGGWRYEDDGGGKNHLFRFSLGLNE